MIFFKSNLGITGGPDYDILCIYFEGDLLYKNPHFSFCDETGISSLNSSEINIYPNPANDKVFIEYNKSDLSAKYCVFNYLGTEIFSGQIKNDITEIDISTLPNGVYFLRIENEIMKFVVVK